jgi:hypothetical protein
MRADHLTSSVDPFFVSNRLAIVCCHLAPPSPSASASRFLSAILVFHDTGAVASVPCPPPPPASSPPAVVVSAAAGEEEVSASIAAAAVVSAAVAAAVVSGGPSGGGGGVVVSSDDMSVCPAAATTAAAESRCPAAAETSYPAQDPDRTVIAGVNADQPCETGIPQKSVGS